MKFCKIDNHFKHLTAIFLKVAAVFLLVISIGCEGGRGIDGTPIDAIDLTPPEVKLTSPPPDSVIYIDEITFKAEARDPGGQVHYVLFYFNGSATVGGDSSIVYSPPYEQTYNFAEESLLEGMLTVNVVAVDTAGNEAQTPFVIFRKRTYSGSDTLHYYKIGGAPAPLLMPYIGLSGEEGDTVRELSVSINYYTTRFTAPRRCELTGVEFLFYSPHHWLEESFLVDGAADFYAVVAAENERSDVPGEDLDSVLTMGETIYYDSWTHVDLSSMNGDTSGYVFEEGESFFVGIRSTDTFVEDIGTYVLILGNSRDYATNLDPSPQKNRTWRKEDGPDGRGWGTILDHFSTEEITLKYDLMIRAIIDYREEE